MTDALLAFLQARLDKDAAVAQAATERQSYDEWDAAGDDREGDTARSHWEVVGIARMKPTPAARDLATHIARHDPERVLAEVEAKRQIVDLHREIEDPEEMQDYCSECDLGRAQYPYFPCTTLRLLGLPYADHPDYRPEWRP